MGTLTAQRTAAIGGFLLVILTLVSAFIVMPPPSPDEAPAKFLEYYTDHRSVLLAQAILAMLGNIPALVFAAGLWNLLRREEGTQGVFAPAAIFAFISVGVMTSVSGCWTAGVAFLGDGNGLDEGSAHTLALVGMLFNIGIFSFIAPTVAFSGIVFLRGSTLPRWLGWIGLAIGLVSLAATFTVATSGAFQPFGPFSFVSFFSTMAYFALISVFMWIRPAPAAIAA